MMPSRSPMRRSHACLVKSADGAEATARAHNVVPFTAATSADMKSFHEGFAQMPAHVTAEIMRAAEPIDKLLLAERVAGFSALGYIATVESTMVVLETAVVSTGGLAIGLPGMESGQTICSQFPRLHSCPHPG